MSDRSDTVTEADLVAYADGRLDGPRAAEVADWLADRPEDAARIEAWRRQTRLLKSVFDPVAAEPVPAAIATTVRGRRHRFRMAAAVAAAVVLAFPAGLAAGWYLSQARPDAAMQRLAESGLAAHRIYSVEVRHPVEVAAAEEQHLVTWLTRRLDAPVRAPDLSADGLALLGGRLVPVEGAPAALLMYEAASGERYTLLVTRFANQRMTAFRYVEENGAGAFYWIDDSLGYVLTGPADRPGLLRIAATVYDQLD